MESSAVVSNSEVAEVLMDIAVLLDMEGVKFKPRAYENAARAIESLDRDVEEIYVEGGLDALMEIPGVGESIAKKIEELLKTGHLKYYEDLKRQVPVNIESLASVEGLGPKTVKELYLQLGVKTLEDLEAAARSGRIRGIPGFGVKREANILRSIDALKSSRGRFLLGDVLPTVRSILHRFESMSEVKAIDVSGSVRRWKETVGDVDFLVISDQPAKVMDVFVSLPQVASVHSHGVTRSSVRLKSNMNADIRVIPEQSFGAALQYFTGSKPHNIALRRIAIARGWKLNEYGLFEGREQVAGATEVDVYGKLGLQWIPPELRENKGEIEAAQQGKLPHLVEYSDVKGDLQVHTTWTDGTNSIASMADEALKTDLEYIAITDHTKGLTVVHGLDEARIRTQMREIDKLNRSLSGIQILKGCEVNIQRDGSLDLEDSALADLDIVGAAVHSYWTLPEAEQTERLIKVMENDNVDFIIHPTSREIGKRPPIQLDFYRIIQAAKDTDTILEIDSYPNRLDLKDDYVRRCVEAGVKLSIDTDAHARWQLHFREFGVATARRGWATRDDIVNTRSVKDLLDMLK